MLLFMFHETHTTDDGDQLDGVSDAFVFPKFDYLLDTKSLEKQWMGVRNVTDKRSNDNWARLVGYHEATIDGKVHSFPLLSGKLSLFKYIFMLGGDLMSYVSICLFTINHPIKMP